MIVREALDAAEKALADAGVDTARYDAEWLAACALEEGRAELALATSREMTVEEEERFCRMVSRRLRREPLAYVIGTCNFRGLELEVGPGCLVPRPETEVTAERAIVHARERPGRPSIVDVGTGSGAIALAMAAEVPNARVFATEKSAAARGWALRNLARTALRCTLLPGNLMYPLHPALCGVVDVVVSNPPYLSAAEWESLQPEVRNFEPRDAVLAGPTGLEVVHELCEQARMWLAPGGWLVVELAPHQAEAVRNLLEYLGYVDAAIVRDMAQRDRVIEARWPGR